MQITQHTDYAFRILLYAACNPERLVNIKTIADVYQVSKAHLMKVVPTLVKHGFLISVRGNQGGIKLACPANQINIGAVFRATESLQLVECMSQDNQCCITPACRLAKVFYGAKQAFMHYLESFTVADLVDDKLISLLRESDDAVITIPIHQIV